MKQKWNILRTKISTLSPALVMPLVVFGHCNVSSIFFSWRCLHFLRGPRPRIGNRVTSCTCIFFAPCTRTVVDDLYSIRTSSRYCTSNGGISAHRPSNIINSQCYYQDLKLVDYLSSTNTTERSVLSIACGITWS